MVFQTFPEIGFPVQFHYRLPGRPVWKCSPPPRPDRGTSSSKVELCNSRVETEYFSGGWWRVCVPDSSASRRVGSLSGERTALEFPLSWNPRARGT